MKPAYISSEQLVVCVRGYMVAYNSAIPEFNLLTLLISFIIQFNNWYWTWKHRLNRKICKYLLSN